MVHRNAEKSKWLLRFIPTMPGHCLNTVSHFIYETNVHTPYTTAQFIPLLHVLTITSLLLLQTLQLHSLNVLAFSTTFFHLCRSWMQSLQLYNYIAVIKEYNTPGYLQHVKIRYNHGHIHRISDIRSIVWITSGVLKPSNRAHVQLKAFGIL
jgi:hypothetical protein